MSEGMHTVPAGCGKISHLTDFLPLIALFHLLAGKIRPISNVLNFQDFRKGTFSFFPEDTVFCRKKITQHWKNCTARANNFGT